MGATFLRVFCVLASLEATFCRPMHETDSLHVNLEREMSKFAQVNPQKDIVPSVRGQQTR